MLLSNIINFDFSAWVNGVWDAEFTEMLPMEDNIEGELAASSEQDFRRLYSCLLGLSEEQLQSSSRDDCLQV